MTAAAVDDLPSGGGGGAERYLPAGVAAPLPEGASLRDVIVHYPRHARAPDHVRVPAAMPVSMAARATVCRCVL